MLLNIRHTLGKASHVGEGLHKPLEHIRPLEIAVVVEVEVHGEACPGAHPLDGGEHDGLLEVGRARRLDEPEEDVVEELRQLALQMVDEVQHEVVEDLHRDLEDVVEGGQRVLEEREAEVLLDRVGELLAAAERRARRLQHRLDQRLFGTTREVHQPKSRRQW